MRYYPDSWLDRAVGACLRILAGAVAIYVAVCLIEAVAVPLLIIGGIVLALGVGIAFLRARSRGW